MAPVDLAPPAYRITVFLFAAGALLLFAAPAHRGAKSTSLIVGLALGAAALSDKTGVLEPEQVSQRRTRVERQAQAATNRGSRSDARIAAHAAAAPPEAQRANRRRRASRGADRVGCARPGRYSCGRSWASAPGIYGWRCSRVRAVSASAHAAGASRHRAEPVLVRVECLSHASRDASFRRRAGV